MRALFHAFRTMRARAVVRKGIAGKLETDGSPPSTFSPNAGAKLAGRLARMGHHRKLTILMTVEIQNRPKSVLWKSKIKWPKPHQYLLIFERDIIYKIWVRFADDDLGGSTLGIPDKTSENKKWEISQ